MLERQFATMEPIVLNCGLDPQARPQRDELLYALLNSTPVMLPHDPLIAITEPAPKLPSNALMSITYNNQLVEGHMLLSRFSYDLATSFDTPAWVKNHYPDAFQINKPLRDTMTITLNKPISNDDHLLTLPFGTKPFAYYNPTRYHPLQIHQHLCSKGTWILSTFSQLEPGTQIYVEEDKEFLQEKPTHSESRPLAKLEDMPPAWQNLINRMNHDESITQAQRLAILAHAWASVFTYDFYKKFTDAHVKNPHTLNDWRNFVRKNPAQAYLADLGYLHQSDEESEHDAWAASYPAFFDESPEDYIWFAHGNCSNISYGLHILSRFIGVPSRIMVGSYTYGGILFEKPYGHAFTAHFVDGRWHAVEPQAHPRVYNGRFPHYPKHYNRLIQEMPRH